MHLIFVLKRTMCSGRCSIEAVQLEEPIKGWLWNWWSFETGKNTSQLIDS